MRKTVTFAKLSTREDGSKCWKLGNQNVGSWQGPNPKGGIYFRGGLLDLFTGEYTIYKPNTDIFTR